ncbi:MAG: peptidyl-prolyl cis-trans isomerase [Haliea sp.]|nr:peptidyl-prolyl cis-trans isomerase [Haliea sp.]
MNKQLDSEVEAALRSEDLAALAAEEYKANKAKYTRPEEVSAAHILISLEGRTQEEALSRATGILARLEAGEDFGALASEYSDDPGSKQSGGELGFFARGRMVKPFEDAAFAMTKPGEISTPVKSDFGYHLIRYNERRPEQQLSFEKVEPRILAEVKKRTQQSLRQDKLHAVRSGAVDMGLEVNGPLLEEIIQRYSKPVETGPTKQ